MLPETKEHNKNFSGHYAFNYSSRQIAIARKFRTGFYERLFTPEAIFCALKYCPITLDIEIFSSINSDMDGVITIPDEDDENEEYSHSVSVLSYDKNSDMFTVNTNWRNWGKKGLGKISSEYIRKHIISAFAADYLAGLQKINPKYFFRKKIKIDNKKYSIKVITHSSFSGDNRKFLNFEIFDAGGLLAGWMHYAYDTKYTLEIQDLFILKEYREMGLGSFLLQELVRAKKIKRIYGYISAFDLIKEREEIVKSFFIKNNFITYLDNSHYHDCRYRFEDMSREN
ncbi:MAG: GNAT family N-acetyltransferase [Candidatus Falkowbacteria bacterium]